MFPMRRKEFKEYRKERYLLYCSIRGNDSSSPSSSLNQNTLNHNDIGDFLMSMSFWFCVQNAFFRYAFNFICLTFRIFGCVKWLSKFVSSSLLLWFTLATPMIRIDGHIFWHLFDRLHKDQVIVIKASNNIDSINIIGRQISCQS